ncbi:LacI family transcriptional regulator [Motilibacter rhizosphaerae]|uniref:LacI family transcriptional regulator n=1 Tax=Motilibacter rhizosphaerae TaxID=598652 RepID=A0A4Q7NVB5_9ACTN|nr:LacI family DNA-binding transcriptional regulator [Motilibacter rhizosphaerae]RZS91064.1 LacI family transcriptional regulator [Motilibacter rhizosphaerae]
MAAASIKDVASLAGVSVGTVSNVLNRPEVVSDVTRERVEQAIAKLGFVRNESARALRAGRSRTVGMLVLDVANPFFTDVARGVEEVVTAHHSVLALYNTAEDPRRETTHLKHLQEQRVQGVLLTPVDLGNAAIRSLVEAGTPVVLVDRSWPRADHCSVAVDDVHGGGLAASHLLEQGRERLAFLGGPLSTQQVADRYRGAVAALDGSPDAVLRLVETPALTVAAGRDAGAALAALPAERRPTGIICANDLLALGVLQAMTRAGLRVPDDIALVGYDDIDYAAAAAVPLSSVRQPRELLGETAARLLFEEIGAADGPHQHQQVVFEPELVVRDSSRTGADA